MTKNLPGIALALGLSLLLEGVARAASLLDVYNAAKGNDPIFLAAEYQLRAAREARPQALSAMLPNIRLQSDNRLTRVDTGSEGITFTGNSLTLSQNIFRWSHYVNLSRANLQVAQAKLEYSTALQALTLRSAESYFAVLAAKDNLVSVRSQKDAIQRQLEQARRRFEVGLTAIVDVKEAQAQFDLAVAGEIVAENQLAAAREALRVLTNSEPDTLQPLRETMPMLAPDPVGVDAWITAAHDSNLQLLLARIAADLARKGVDLERAARWPSADLTGSYGSANYSTTGESERAVLRLQITVPLYTGGRTSSRVREALANREAARQQLNARRRAVELQTRDAYRNVVADISRVQAFKQAFISTKSGAEATQAGFDVGTRTAVEVLSALRETYRAQAEYASARYDYVINTLRLREAVGTLSAADIMQVDAWLAK